MYKSSFKCTVFFLFAVCALLSQLKAAEKETIQQTAARVLSAEASFEKGKLTSIQGIPTLVLEGTPREMGRQYGHLLKDLLKQIETFLTTRVFVNKAEEIAALRKARQCKKNIPHRYREEMETIALEAGIEYRSLLLLNSIPDFYNSGCSTFCVWGKRSFDSKPIFGRNLDYFTFDIADKLVMLIVFKPKAKVAFATPSIAGFSGLYSGMNSESLSIGNMISLNAKKKYIISVSEKEIKAQIEEYKKTPPPLSCGCCHAESLGEYLELNFMSMDELGRSIEIDKGLDAYLKKRWDVEKDAYVSSLPVSGISSQDLEKRFIEEKKKAIVTEIRNSPLKVEVFLKKD